MWSFEKRDRSSVCFLLYRMPCIELGGWHDHIFVFCNKLLLVSIATVLWFMLSKGDQQDKFCVPLQHMAIHQVSIYKTVYLIAIHHVQGDGSVSQKNSRNMIVENHLSHWCIFYWSNALLDESLECVWKQFGAEFMTGSNQSVTDTHKLKTE